MSKAQIREFSKVLSTMFLTNGKSPERWPEFEAFVTGKRTTLEVGIFRLTRYNKEGTLFGVSTPKAKRGETVEFRIGATVVLLTGVRSIQFVVNA